MKIALRRKSQPVWKVILSIIVLVSNLYINSPQIKFHLATYLFNLDSTNGADGITKTYSPLSLVASE